MSKRSLGGQGDNVLRSQTLFSWSFQDTKSSQESLFRKPSLPAYGMVRTWGYLIVGILKPSYQCCWVGTLQKRQQRDWATQWSPGRNIFKGLMLLPTISKTAHLVENRHIRGVFGKYYWVGMWGIEKPHFAEPWSNSRAMRLHLRPVLRHKDSLYCLIPRLLGGVWGTVELKSGVSTNTDWWLRSIWIFWVFQKWHQSFS